MNGTFKRNPRSHIRPDGRAKVAYATEPDARRATPPGGISYLCEQNPNHWHVTSGRLARAA
jgi:hypothetical protein